MTKSGFIYEIKCLETDKSYIGQTRYSVEYRWNSHLKRARVPSSAARNTCFLRALRKYPATSFVVMTLETCPVEHLDSREKHWIAERGTIAPGGYNLAVGGAASPMHAVSKAKISKALKGRVFSPETITKMRAAAHTRHRQYPESYIRSRTKHSLRGKPVLATSPDGTSWWFRSVSHAAQAGFGKTSIRMCLSGHQKTHKNWTWVWAEGTWQS